LIFYDTFLLIIELDGVNVGALIKKASIDYGKAVLK